MKESIGGTQLFAIVISLILLFAGITALTVNRSNAFTVKDQLVAIIEKAGGFDMTSEIIVGATNNNETLQQIVDSLSHNSYRQTGTCPEPNAEENYKEVSAYQRNGQKVMGNNRASFCIVKLDSNSPEGIPKSYYYKIIVFYTLDLPVVKSVFNFKVEGETKSLYS